MKKIKSGNLAPENNTETYSFNALYDFTSDSIGNALIACNKKNKNPVIVCVGSDLVLGDSLGPLVGTMLIKRKVCAFVYGTLNAPLTAKEVVCAKTQISLLHPNSFTVAIDAAVGNREDIGLIKVTDRGLKPGLGVDKNLGTLGDCSVIGIVAGKSLQNYNLFNLTRLNLIYKMAEKIADGIEKFLTEFTAVNRLSALAAF